MHLPALLSFIVIIGATPGLWGEEADPFLILDPQTFHHHVAYFNDMENEHVTNHVSNADSWKWLQANIPLFECADREVEEIYYYRWWSFRKHLKRTEQSFVLTEFLTPVGHAGRFNTISCAAGHHIAEGRWLRNSQYLDDYIHFWLRGDEGNPQPHFHKYSSWFAAAVWNRYLVTGDRNFTINLLEDLVADYRAWEKERQLPSGLFWQYDVRDGMEESISGSRTAKQARPTINSYMFANAKAVASIAHLASRPDLAREFEEKASELKRLILEILWDPNAQFFKVQKENGQLAEVREAIGFIPWCFNLPGKDYEPAWAQFVDPQGFLAPFGITTAERRHPEFRSHGTGTCEWDGAVWPFATSQTLTALANVLNLSSQSVVTESDYFDAFLTYVHSHRFNGTPYIGEYLDEITGEWLKGKSERSRYYNHSTFADLLITGMVGLRPRAVHRVEVHPLLPQETWDWFCLDGLSYHDRILTIFWDADGTRYGRGPGLHLIADGKVIGRADALEPLRAKLP